MTAESLRTILVARRGLWMHQVADACAARGAPGLGPDPMAGAAAHPWLDAALAVAVADLGYDAADLVPAALSPRLILQADYRLVEALLGNWAEVDEGQQGDSADWSQLADRMKEALAMLRAELQKPLVAIGLPGYGTGSVGIAEIAAGTAAAPLPNPWHVDDLPEHGPTWPRRRGLVP